MSTKRTCVLLLTLYVLLGLSIPLVNTTQLIVDYEIARIHTLSGEIPTISLIQPANESSITEGTIIQVRVASVDLDAVLFNWDNATTNSTWSSPYLSMVPSSIGDHTLHVYANNTDDEWSYSKFVFTTYSYNPVEFAAAWGGYGDDTCEDVAIAPDGSICIVGYTQSDDYPTQNAIDSTFDGFGDVFLTKLDPTGSYLNFSTYFGGDGDDYPRAMVIDTDGYIYVSGNTQSTDFPTTSGAYLETSPGEMDGWVAKFSPNGSLVYCTLIGGSDEDYAIGVSVDSGGNCHVIGTTKSTDFPLMLATQGTFGGENDVFITILNPNGSSLVFSTYLGGNENDNGYDIVVGHDDRFYVTGNSHSNDFPVVNAISYGGGGVDAFLAKYDVNGTSVLYSTLYGGNYQEESQVPLAVDSNGNCYITGWCGSDDLPLLNAFDTSLGGYYDAFVAKFSSDFTLEFSSYLGGSDNDVGKDIAIDIDGYVFVAMESASDDTPTLNPFDGTQSGHNDGYIAVLDVTYGELRFASFIGGLSIETDTAIAVSPSQHCFVSGVTMSIDFPVTEGVYDYRTSPGSRDIYLLKTRPGVPHVEIRLQNIENNTLHKSGTPGQLAFTTYLTGIDNLTYYWDTTSSSDLTDPYEVYLPEGDGPHRLGVELVDTDGGIHTNYYVFEIDDSPPVITGPGYITYTEGDVDQLIVWNASDPHLQSFEITKDGVPIDSGALIEISELIEVDASGLTPGYHHYELLVYDDLENYATDVVTVYVRALESTPTTTPTNGTGPPDTLSEAMTYVGIVGSVVVILYVIVEVRKHGR